MTATAGHRDVDAVREATDLVRLVSEHVALKARGREYVGLCPFHDDHRPSFSVVTHKGDAFYHCFACGASGDCFRFVMEFHKMDFPEALRFLAERAGVTLQARGERTAAGGPRREDLRRAVAHATRFFQQCLATDAGAQARAHLDGRGIRPETIERFQIGAAPAGYDGYLKQLGGRPATVATAEKAGLVRARTGGGHYDTFRGRVIFPICDEVGRPIAFGGRSIDPDDQPKYLNSPENPLFDKSKVLYGLHLAKRAIIEAGEAIVTEGYTDVIGCHQAGVENVIGTLGTALTSEHAKRLSRLCDRVVVLFDGDDAGRRAADRAVEVFFREPVDVRICVLPEGVDPDELVRTEGGVDRLRTLVADAVEALAYKLARFEATLTTADGLSARQRRLEGFLTELANLGFGELSGLRKQLVVNRVADLMGLGAEDVLAALPRRQGARATTEVTPASAPASETPVGRARRLAEEEILAFAIFAPEAGPTVLGGADPEDFADPTLRSIATELTARPREACTVTTLQNALERPEDRARVAELFFEGERRSGGDAAEAAMRLDDAVAAFDRLRQRERYDRQLEGTMERGESDALLDMIRKRQEQGDRPAAISRGPRSS